MTQLPKIVLDEFEHRSYSQVIAQSYVGAIRHLPRISIARLTNCIATISVSTTTVSRAWREAWVGQRYAVRPERPLFVTNGFHGIEGGRTPGGEPAGEYACRDQDGDDHGERQRIGRGNSQADLG